MAARTTSSCFSFLKEAQLFLARILKVLAPLLLYPVVVFPITAINIVYVSPLTVEMGRHITEMEHADPLSAEYAGLLEEVRQEATELLVISVAIALVLLTVTFAKQIVAFTTHSGDRYSLTELLRQVVKYAKGPLIATAAVTMLQVTSLALLDAYFDSLSKSLSVFFPLAAQVVFLWLGIAAVVIVAASVVVEDPEVPTTLTDEGSGGVCGLRQAWRRITRARRNDEYVLVLVTLLLPTVLGPLYAVALLYTKQSTGLGLCLLSAYEHNLSDLYYYMMVASVYSSRTRKEVPVACDDYAQIPSGEANI